MSDLQWAIAILLGFALVFAIIAAVIWRLVRAVLRFFSGTFGRKQPSARLAPRDGPGQHKSIPVPEFDEPFAFHTKVFGVTFRNEDGSSRQRIIRKCRCGEELRLVPDPDNLVDPHAVAVKRLNGQQIGYLRRELSHNLSGVLLAGECYECRIADLTGGHCFKPIRGVNLFIRSIY